MSLTTENKWRGLLLYTSFSGATDELPAHHVRLLIFTVVVMEKTGRLAGYPASRPVLWRKPPFPSLFCSVSLLVVWNVCTGPPCVLASMERMKKTAMKPAVSVKSCVQTAPERHDALGLSVVVGRNRVGVCLGPINSSQRFCRVWIDCIVCGDE